MPRGLIKYVFPICFALYVMKLPAQNAYLSGQLISWCYFSEKGWSQTLLGLQYISTFSLEKYVSEQDMIDGELALHFNISGFPDSLKSFERHSKIEPYRLWLRYSSTQFEVRAGLQKINFGSATLIRPLMWFERMDPRDPLQLAEGVYGILFRYYFLNNANVWLWGLFGNQGTKGWETLSTYDQVPEYGARMQTPFLNGEIALSYHGRKVAKNENLGITEEFAENRLGIDGKWDYEIGIWLEAVQVTKNSNEIFYKHDQLLNLGLDYTFALGNGLHLLTEYFLSNKSNEFFGSGPTIRMSGLLADYRLGLLDYLIAVFFYDLGNKDSYRFLSWQRSYDNWSIYLNFFWNPEYARLGHINDFSSTSFGSGKGLQIMIVFNH